MKTLAATAVSLVLLAGCVGQPNVPPVQYYVLGEGQQTASPSPSPRRVSQAGSVLLVQPTSVNSFYDTQRLVYSRAEGQRAYYQFAAWTERPGHRFSSLLSRRLSAPMTTSGVKGDLVLRTRVEELYHDATWAPGTVKIALSAELVDSAGRLVAEREFSESVPVADANAAAAVEAANRGVAALLDAVAAWVEGRDSRGVAAAGAPG